MTNHSTSNCPLPCVTRRSPYYVVLRMRNWSVIGEIGSLGLGLKMQCDQILKIDHGGKFSMISKCR